MSVIALNSVKTPGIRAGVKRNPGCVSKSEGGKNVDIFDLGGGIMVKMLFSDFFKLLALR